MQAGRLECGACGATLHVEDGLRTTRCPYCASPQVLERPPGATSASGAPEPTFVMPFVVTRERALDVARHWTRSRGVFTHGGVRHASLEDVRGVYVPVVLYGAVSHADYEARIGEEYEETEKYTTTENGKQVTRERKVTRVEWRPLGGRRTGYVRDVFVSASRGVADGELDALEPFALRLLRRYTPLALSGFVAEDASRTPAACADEARAQAAEDVRRAVSAFLPGDRHELASCAVVLENDIFEPLLVPVWSLAVRYAEGKPPVRLLVNGQTGRASGEAPISAARIAMAIFVALTLLAAVVLAIVSARGGAS